MVVVTAATEVAVLHADKDARARVVLTVHEVCATPVRPIVLVAQDNALDLAKEVVA